MANTDRRTRYDDPNGYHGFLYDNTDWTTIDKPGAHHTFVQGIYGDNIVGYYIGVNGINGFLPTPATVPDPPPCFSLGLRWWELPAQEGFRRMQNCPLLKIYSDMSRMRFQA